MNNNVNHFSVVSDEKKWFSHYKEVMCNTYESKWKCVVIFTVDVIYLDMMRYRCEPGPLQAMAHLADVLNSRPALTVSTPERERERACVSEWEHDGTIKFDLYVTPTCFWRLHQQRMPGVFFSVSNPTSFLLAVTATSERAQASIVAVSITLGLVLLAVVVGFLLSGR